MYDNLPKELKELKQWVCTWSGSKTPMQAKIKKAASSIDPATWSDYATACAAVERGIYDNIGFVFNENGIVGIDIDKGYDEEGFLSEISIDILNVCQSFTEKSRSGRGMHIFVKADLPFKGKNNLNGVEIYKCSRYFIVTGKRFIFPNIIENQAAIDYVVEKYFNETAAATPKNGKQNTQTIYRPIYTNPDNGKVLLRPTYPPIPDGCRNLSLTSLAGQLHNQGYTKAQIYKEVSHCNSVACTPPLSDGEIRTIINSVTRYARQ